MVDGVPRIIDTKIVNILSRMLIKILPKPLSPYAWSIFAALTRAINNPRAKEITRAQRVTIIVVLAHLKDIYKLHYR